MHLHLPTHHSRSESAAFGLIFSFVPQSITTIGVSGDEHISSGWCIGVLSGFTDTHSGPHDPLLIDYFLPCLFNGTHALHLLSLAVLYPMINFFDIPVLLSTHQNNSRLFRLSRHTFAIVASFLLFYFLLVYIRFSSSSFFSLRAFLLGRYPTNGWMGGGSFF